VLAVTVSAVTQWKLRASFGAFAKTVDSRFGHRQGKSYSRHRRKSSSSAGRALKPKADRTRVADAVNASISVLTVVGIVSANLVAITHADDMLSHAGRVGSRHGRRHNGHQTRSLCFYPWAKKGRKIRDSGPLGPSASGSFFNDPGHLPHPRTIRQYRKETWRV